MKKRTEINERIMHGMSGQHDEAKKIKILDEKIIKIFGETSAK